MKKIRSTSARLGFVLGAAMMLFSASPAAAQTYVLQSFNVMSGANSCTSNPGVNPRFMVGPTGSIANNRITYTPANMVTTATGIGASAVAQTIASFKAIGDGGVLVMDMWFSSFSAGNVNALAAGRAISAGAGSSNLKCSNKVDNGVLATLSFFVPVTSRLTTNNMLITTQKIVNGYGLVRGGAYWSLVGAHYSYSDSVGKNFTVVIPAGYYVLTMSVSSEAYVNALYDIEPHNSSGNLGATLKGGILITPIDPTTEA
jgi:hypothetical protein